MATSSKAAKPGTAPASLLTGVQRRQNAASRLVESRQTVAQIAVQIADLHAQIETMAREELKAQKSVKAAETAADLAAAHVVDTQSHMMVADGTAGESAAEADYNGAIAGNQEARKALDEARATLADVHQKNNNDAAPIRSQIDELEHQQRNLNRLIQSLEQRHAEAHHVAGVEALLAHQDRHQQLQEREKQLRQQLADTQSDIDEHRASVEALVQEHPELEETSTYCSMADKEATIRAILTRYLDWLDELQKGRATPDALGHIHAGYSLPHILAPDLLNRNTLHAILLDSADTPAHQQSSGIIEQIRAGAVELLAELDAQRERKLAGLPPAT